MHLEGAGEGQTIISLSPNTQTLVFVEVILAWFGRGLGGGGGFVSVCVQARVCVFVRVVGVQMSVACARANRL